jgi:acyl carrier protein
MIKKKIYNVYNTYYIPISDIYLIKERSILKTTSGKLKRVETKNKIKINKLEYLYHYQTEINLDVGLLGPNILNIQQKLKQILIKNLNIQLTESEINTETTFTEYGIDSILGAKLINQIQSEFEIEIKIHSVYVYSNIHKMSIYIDSLSRVK